MRHANIIDENIEYLENKNKKYKVLLYFIPILLLFYLFIKNWLEDKPNSFYLVYIIIFLCIFLTTILFIKKIINKDYCIEKIFLICIIPLGIIYTLLIPPGIVPDEWTHMYNTLSLASQLTGQETNNKITMRDTEMELYSKQVTTPNNDYYDYVYNNILNISNNNNYSNTNINSPAMSQMFGYFPAVIGTIIARLLHLGGVTTFYIGRLCNFLFYLTLTYYAIKKIPFGKVLLFAITMLPMTCHQMCSLSYDTIINATSFFAIAYGMFFVYQSNRVKLQDIIIYGLCGILLLINKGSAYAFILVIPILARYFNPNNEEFAKKTKVIIFLIVVICIFLLNYRAFIGGSQQTAIGNLAGETTVPWAGTPAYTLSSLIKNISTTINLFITTFVQKGGYYITTAIGSLLGWLAIPLSNWIINVWMGILVISSLSEKSDNEVFTYEHKFLYLFIALAVILIVMLAMALAWTPMNYPTIEGVQGRYYIPILFLLLIIIQNSKIYLKENKSIYVIILVQVMSIITVINLITLVL